MDANNFSKKEISSLRKLNTPTKIQDFIELLDYNKGRRVSIADVLRKRKADCLEAACFASLVFTLNGYDNFIMDLEAEKDDDHVICVFKHKSFFGAVAQSKYLGLRYKSPVYRNIRELTMSYFEHYFNFKGVLDLKRRSIPVRLPEKIGKWAFSVKYVYEIEEKLRTVEHVRVLPKNIELPKVRKLVYQQETMVLPRSAKVGKEYLDAIKKIKKI